MNDRSRIARRVGLLLLVCAVVVAAKPPAPPKPPATDPVDVVEIPGSQNPLYGLIVTPDGQTLISVDSARHVFLWVAGTWQLRVELIPDEKTDGVITLALSRGGDLLAVSGSGYVDVWDLHADKRIAAMRAGNFHSLLFSDDGKTLYGQSIRGLYAMDIAGGKTVATYPVHSNRAPAFITDGKTLVSGVYPVKSGITYSYVDPAGPIPKVPEQFRANGNGLLVTPDGKTAISLDAEAEHVVWWEQATGNRLGTIAMTDAVRLALSPDGKTLAAAFDRGKVLLIDLANGQAVRTLDTVNVIGRGLTFTPDGKNLAILTEKTVKIYPLTDATTRPAATEPATRPTDAVKPGPRAQAPRALAPRQTPAARPPVSGGRTIPGGDVPSPADVAPGGF